MTRVEESVKSAHHRIDGLGEETQEARKMNNEIWLTIISTVGGQRSSFR